MTSELSSWMPLIALRSAPQLPCQTPLVNGCIGPTARAHWNTCGSSAVTSFCLFATLGYTFAGLSGSFHRSQPEDAIVVAEQAHHARDVVVQNALIAGIGEVRGARALHPAGVVHARGRRALRTQHRIRVPAGVEQDEQRLDAVTCRDRDELRETAGKALLVLGPQQIVEKHPHGVEPDSPSHASTRRRCDGAHRWRPETSRAD